MSELNRINFTSSRSYFRNKEPITNKKKSFIGFIFCALLVFTPLTYYSLQNFRTLGLSEIHITCKEDIETKDYVKCKFEIPNEYSFKEGVYVDAKIKIRGRSVSREEKKGYRLELTQNWELLGMRKDDDWQLFAMAHDMTRMRYKVSFELWRSLFPSNPTAILPDSRYVKLYLNDEYQGLYLLAEKHDRKLFDLDKTQKDINSSLIFQSVCLDGHISLGEYYDKHCWEQDWPDHAYIMEDTLDDLTEFVTGTNDEEFFDPKEDVYTVFDKGNLIDFFLFNFYILHRDFWVRNYYLLRDTAPNKFYLIPWDFDHSFGQFKARYYLEADNDVESYIRKGNYLFNRLMDNDDFMRDCKNRWRELRKKLWTEDFVLEMLEELYEEIKNDLERDLNMWQPKQDPQKYIDLLFEWIPERLDYCDDYFDKI